MSIWDSYEFLFLNAKYTYFERFNKSLCFLLVRSDLNFLVEGHRQKYGFRYVFSYCGRVSRTDLRCHMATFSFWCRKTTHVRISKYSHVCVELEPIR